MSHVTPCYKNESAFILKSVLQKVGKNSRRVHICSRNVPGLHSFCINPSRCEGQEMSRFKRMNKYYTICLLKSRNFLHINSERLDV